MAKDAGTRWAAIDIGSDTVHLLVGDVVTGESGLKTVRHSIHRSELLELGRDVADRGRLRGRSVEALERILPGFVNTARRSTENVVLAATEAVRRASNGNEVVRKLSTSIGIPIYVLSGMREAELSFLAARDILEPDGCQLLIDSGGASTEVSVMDGRSRVASVSLPLGAAALAADLPGDPPRPLPWALFAARIGAELTRLPPAQPRLAWGTGGSAHNLAGLEPDSRREALDELTFGTLDRLCSDLLRKPANWFAARSGEAPARVALLAPGALIIAAILQHYGLGSCRVVRAGMRDGMILAAHEHPDAWWQDDGHAL